MPNNAFIDRLRRIVGDAQVRVSRVDAELYSYDASLAQSPPGMVVFPADTAEAARVVREAHRAGVTFVPRGFGTNLSGGTVLPVSGLVVCMSRFNRILGIYPESRHAVVQPGVTNLELQNALAPQGFFYAPDPASQKVATLGGNVGENSGGPRCLKYGVTTNHVLGLEMILADGEIVHLGGSVLDPPGYDLRGAVIGSEGTLGLVTEITVRILPFPESIITMLAIYDDIADAARSVSDIIAAGIVPTTLEMMDAPIIEAVEDSYACGYPRDAAAVLIIEVEGPRSGLREQAEEIKAICMDTRCRTIREAQNSAERNRLWEGRRGAFGAVARLAPNYLVNDCTVPRNKLPQALATVAEITRKYRFRHGNVFHAGDGNLHPLIFFDSRDADQMARVKKAGWEIMQACVALGGTISGEHGIGIEKLEAMHLVFSEADCDAQRSLKTAFDAGNRLNPGKVVPPPGSMAGKDGDLIGETAEMAAQEEREAERDLVERIGRALGDRRPVVPVGCGTAADYGNLTHPEAQPVSSRDLDRVIEYDPANQVVTAGAGMPLYTLQDRLRDNGQWLPLRPPTALQDRSVGGVVAQGACGPERAAYGAPRDLLLGLRFVNATGRVINTGGRVVKNVAGYDLTRLMAGSAGTLGFILRATLRVAIIPEACRAVTADGDLVQCAAVATTLITSNRIPTFVVATRCDGTNTLPENGRSAWRLHIGFEGRGGVVADQARQVGDQLEKAGLQNVRLTDYDVYGGHFQEQWEQLGQQAFMLRADMPQPALAEFLDAVPGVDRTAPLMLDWTCGRVVAGLAEVRASHWAQWSGRAKACGGHALLEKAPPEFKRDHDVFGPSRSAWGVMHRVKKALDPHGVFAPGRLPGRV